MNTTRLSGGISFVYGYLEQDIYGVLQSSIYGCDFMVDRKECSECTSYRDRVKMFRFYIRKYDYTGKAKWIPKGWLCDKCNHVILD